MKAKFVLFLAVFMVVSVSLAAAADSGLSSLKFKDTEIATVLKAIEKKADLEGKKITIVTTPEVFGLVTVDLENVDWKTAFKVILKMYDLGYTQDGNILTVSTLTKIGEDQKKEDDAIFASGGMKIEAFKLKHVEAADVAKMITPFLSKDGKVSVLDVVNKQGWGFSASTSGMINVGDGSSGSGGYTQPSAPTNTTKMTRTKILAVSDTPLVVRQVAKLIEEADVAPRQVLIRAILLEVVENKFFDLGLDFGTIDAAGTAGDIFNKDYKLGTASRFTSLGVTNPATAAATSANSGLKFGFSKIEGTQFEVVLHALQEDENTNTLSTPTILTMDGREATILVGEQYPIVDTTSSTNVNNTVGGSLNYYQNIGIQLRVVPQICGDNEDRVNLIVHPTVSNRNGTVDVKGGTSGTAVIAQYPIIDTREAETQMVIDDGDTVVLGGLLSDTKTKDLAGVPFLSNLPLLGKLFDRLEKNGTKKDLLIFLTVKIVRPSTVLPADVLDRTKIDQKAGIA
ncbi:MAG: secretin N-terminal domain-containing protein [Candidatus Omnitrophica bacterium]|nr:secretin N-terminal domain-containing protein [Candidatus Omnitrophota bacterium]